MKMKTKILFTIAFVLIGFTFLTIKGSPVFAATCTWNGSNSANWSDPGNWNAGCSGVAGIPGNGDDLVFPLGATTFVLNDDIGTTTFSSITVNTDYNILGNDINLSGINGIVVNSGAVNIYNNIDLTTDTNFETAGGTLQIGGDLNCISDGLTISTQGNFIWITGQIGGFCTYLSLNGLGVTEFDGLNHFVITGGAGSFGLNQGSRLVLKNDSALGDTLNVLTMANSTTLKIDGHTVYNNISIPG